MMKAPARLKVRRVDYTGSNSYAGFPALVLGIIALVLLTLTTFSLPFVDSLYFLRTSQAGGVRFGIWGWCLDVDNMYSDTLRLGYTWEPQIAVPITKALAFYPLSAILVLLTLITLIPILRDRSVRTLRVFAVFASCSFVCSFLGLVFMIAMWAIAKRRFERAGWGASYGPLPWMSLMATLLLLIVVLNLWKGTLSTLYMTPAPSASIGGRARTLDPEKAAAPTSRGPTAHSQTSNYKSSRHPSEDRKQRHHHHQHHHRHYHQEGHRDLHRLHPESDKPPSPRLPDLLEPFVMLRIDDTILGRPHCIHDHWFYGLP